MASLQNDASAGSSQLGRSAAELGDKVQETAGRVAESQLSKQKKTASGTLDHVAEAIRMTGDHLRDSGQDRVAHYAQQASDKVKRLSESIRDAEPRDVLRRVENVARREPALFLGGAFLLGLIGARFLKSSERSPDTARDTALPPLDRAESGQPYVASRVGARPSVGADENEELGIRSDESNVVGREH
jgi:hypothetical protein